jgi:hypothetical protein
MFATIALQALAELGKIYAGHSFRANSRDLQGNPYWSGVLRDSKGGVHWACTHIHRNPNFATTCAEEALAS